MPNVFPYSLKINVQNVITSKARTSYLNREIQWGYRFMPMLFLDRHHFSADHSMFHSTYEVRMPRYSAKKAFTPEDLIDDVEEEQGKQGKMNFHANIHKKMLNHSDSVSNCNSQTCISSDTVNLLVDSQSFK